MSFLAPSAPARFVTLLIGGLSSSLGVTYCLPLPGMAQLIPDGSLGAEGSIVRPDVTVQDVPAALIEGGAVRGSNLFHSFQEFNVNTGQAVYFANPIEIQNILTRVTGGSLSNIDGLLGVDGAANLFLLNPNGVIFGPNARLDMGGSFTTSTGSSFTFADGSTFSATPTGDELLSISVPLGVQFNNPQGDINSTGILETGADLSLIGNNLYLEGQLLTGADLTIQAADTVTIRDTATDAFLANTGDDLTIQGRQGIDILTLQHLDQTPFVSGGDLHLISDGIISGDAHFASGGGLQFLTLAGTPGDFVSLYDPIVYADGNVVFGNYTGAALKVEATGSIQAGNIRITGPDTAFNPDDYALGSDEYLLATSRAAILRAGVFPAGADDILDAAGDTTFATTDAPIVDQNGNEQPSGSIFVSSISTFVSNISAIAEGNQSGGPIILEATGNIVTTGTTIVDLGFGNLSYALISLAYNRNEQINGGDITIKAGGDVLIDAPIGTGTLANVLARNAIGSGGSVTIESTDGAIVTDVISTSSINGFGSTLNAGNVSLKALGSIKTNGVAAVSLARSVEGTGPANPSSGLAGNITFESIAGNIELQEDLQAYTISIHDVEGASPTAKDAGTINLSAEQGYIRGLDIQIKTFSLFGEENGTLNDFASEAESGRGGDVILRANDEISGLEVLTLSAEREAGNVTLTLSGDENLQIKDVDLVTSAQLQVPNPYTGLNINFATEELGSSGTISIDAINNNLEDNDNLTFDNFIVISDANGGNTGGSIDISSNANLIFKSSKINTNTNSKGAGGGISISAPEIFLDSESSITASSTAILEDGQGGSIALTTNALTVEGDGVIEASTSGSGNGGSLVISSINDKILITGAGSINVDGDATSSGNSGNLELNAPTIIIDETQLSASTAGMGQGGNVTLRAGAINVDNEGRIAASTSGEGAGGSIIFAPPGNNLRLSGNGTISVETSGSGLAGNFDFGDISNLQIDGVRLSASTSGESDSGNIIFNLPGQDLTISGNGTIAVESLETATGSGGTFIVDTKSFTLDGTTLSASTQGGGSGGSFDIDATDSVNLINGAAIAAQALGSGGVAGSIDISASTVTVEGSKVTTSAEADATAGDVSIKAKTVTLTQSGAISATNVDDQTGLGNIALDGLTNLTVENSLISTSTQQGTAGSITINDDGNPETIDLPASTVFLSGRLPDGSAAGGLSAQAEANGGTAGGVTVNAQQITVQDGAAISASNINAGDGGDVTLRSLQSLLVANGGQVTASTDRGRAGDVTVNQNEAAATTVEISGAGSQLAARADAEDGTAGDITVNAQQITVQDGAAISASNINAAQGGNVTLQSLDTLGIANGAQVTTSTESGQAGNVTVNQNEAAATAVNISGTGSQLAAQATQAGGSAGSVLINAADIEVSAGAISATNLDDKEGFSSVTLTGVGTLAISSGGQVTASTDSGRAGDVTVNQNEAAATTVEISGAGSQLAARADAEDGTAGDITVNAQQITVKDGAAIEASNQNAAEGGDITLAEVNGLIVTNGLISTSTQEGTAGSITINDDGNPETIDLPASTVFLSGQLPDGSAGGLSAQAEANGGTAGGVTVNSQQITVQAGAAISASNIDAAQGGNVTLQSLDTLAITSGGQVTASTDSGRAGDVTVNQNETAATTVEISGENSQLAARATGAGGSAGSVLINALDVEVVDFGEISASNQNAALGGDVTLQGANTVTIDSDGRVTASTETGQAGDVTVNARNLVQLSDRGTLSAEATGQGGTAGNVAVTTATVEVTDNARLTSSAGAGATAGNITIDAQAINVAGAGEISATNIDAAQGGNVTLQSLDTLAITSGGQVTASTDSGRAGNVTVNQNEAAATTVDIRGENSQLAARATGAGGSAGSVIVNAQRIIVQDSAAIEASNQNAFEGGDITLQGFNLLAVDNGAITAKTDSGVAGSISITAIAEGDPLVALTNDGRISVEAVTGDAGGIDITTSRFQATDSAITVSSQQGAAGNLTITSTAAGRADPDGFFLDNSELTSRTAKNAAGGSGITLNISDFLIRLRNRSLISAEAIGTATGGNITINAPNSFILADAYDDNDIVAIADQGAGGRIEINAIRLFGFVQRSQDTEGDYRNNNVNDLSATSGVGSNGSVVLNILGIDPSQGLMELPLDLEDRANQITPGCGLGNTDNQSAFVVSGRGGLPPSPSNPIEAGGVSVPWVVGDAEATNATPTTPPPLAAATPLTEAQGIAIDSAGNAYLVATTSSTDPADFGSPAAEVCRAVSSQ